MAIIFTILLILGVSIPLITLACHLQAQAARAAAAWPTVPGLIVQARTECKGSYPDDYEETKIVFSYAVGSEHYSKERTYIDDQTFRAAPEGSPVTVHHNPEEPGEALLRPTDAPTPYGHLIFGLWAITIIGGLLIIW